MRTNGKLVKKIGWNLFVIGLFGLILWQWQQPISKPQDMAVWPAINAEDIVTISIQKQGDSKLVLQLKQGQWRLVNGDIAVQDAVLRLRDDLVGMQVIRIVTRKKDHDAALGMLDRAVLVQCLNVHGVILLDLIIGKQGSDLLSTYVRRVGSHAVVAVNRALLWQVRRSNRAWKRVGNDIGQGVENKKK